MTARIVATPELMAEEILRAVRSHYTTKPSTDDRDVLNARLLARSLWSAGWRFVRAESQVEVETRGEAS